MYKVLEKVEEITSEKGEIIGVSTFFDLKKSFSFKTEDNYCQLLVFNGEVDFELKRFNEVVNAKINSEKECLLISKNTEVKILNNTEGARIVLIKRANYA